MNKEFEHNPSENQSNEFGLPKGYFQNSAKTIFQKIEWQEEHKQFPELLAFKKNSGFVVPQNYFDKKTSSFELLPYHKLFSLKKQHPFYVPDSYFENLKIKQLIKDFSENIEEEPVFSNLIEIPKKISFEVEKNYFEDNTQRLQTLLNKEGDSLVFRLFGPRLTFAAAAALVIAAGIWLFAAYNKTQVPEDCGTIACIEKSDLLKSKNLENFETEDLYELVNTKELEKKLEKKSTNTNKPYPKDTSLNSVSTDDLLDEI